MTRSGSPARKMQSRSVSEPASSIGISLAPAVRNGECVKPSSSIRPAGRGKAAGRPVFAFRTRRENVLRLQRRARPRSPPRWRFWPLQMPRPRAAGAGLRATGAGQRAAGTRQIPSALRSGERNAFDERAGRSRSRRERSRDMADRFLVTRITGTLPSNYISVTRRASKVEADLVLIHVISHSRSDLIHDRSSGSGCGDGFRIRQR